MFKFHTPAHVRSPHAKWVLTALLAAVAALLMFDQHAFLYGALPVLLIFACPLFQLYRRLRDWIVTNKDRRAVARGPRQRRLQ